MCTLRFSNAFNYIPSSTSTTHHVDPKGLSLSSSSVAMDSPEETKGKGGARVAFLGNSILYYNDCPRMLINLGRGSGQHVAYQNSCLRGGTNLSQLWDQGNGMLQHGFATEAARIDNGGGGSEFDVGAETVKDLLEQHTGGSSVEGKKERWDFVVFNDHTQGPARPHSRDATRQTLIENYLPLILANGAPTPIIVETAAYRLPDINNSKDLGDTHEFQRRVREGVELILESLQSNLPQTCKPRLAPVGTAFLHVHDNNHELWEDLFDQYDSFHPSPHGSFLQGCVLHCVMFESPPPLPRTDEDIAALWKDARVMHHPKTGPMRRLPSVEEAEYLLGVANTICCVKAKM